MNKKTSVKSHSSEPKRLYRSRDDKMIAGVCGGIAEHLNVDPVWIRLAAVVLIFANGIGLILYILGWILIPQNPNQSGSDTKSERAAKRIHDSFQGKKRKERHADIEKPCRRCRVSFMGVLFIFLGFVLLMNNLFVWFTAPYVWASAFVAFGAYLIARRLLK
ncbi:PspC domain-containing protein [Candidatus Woesearchaeota archaeon]|nr:PspC domain-containing protein [Candidatus Woesearchaeota archaeon]